MNESRANPRLELNLWGFGTESDDLDLTLSLKPSSVSDHGKKHVPEHREEENQLHLGFGNPPVQPGLWPLMSSSHRSMGDAQAMPSWQQAFIADSQAALPAHAVGGFSGSPFGLFPLQPNLMESRSLAPAPIRQVNFF